MKLSNNLKYWRSKRPSEWLMDEFIKEAEKLEAIERENQLNNLITSTEEWAEARNLIEGSNPTSQFHKLIQECAEWSDDYLKGKDDRIEFGDILVTLVVMAKQRGFTFEECLEMAFNKIKDRKGKMVGGVFVKEADL